MVQAGDVDAVSMRAIAKAVGVTPPAIYAHFADKDELFQAICDSRFGQLNEALAEMDEYDDPLEGLRAGGHAYIRFGLEHPEAYRFLMVTNSEVTNEPSDDPTQGELAFFRLVSKVTECIDAGHLRAMDPLEAAVVLWAHVHGLTMLLIAHKGLDLPENIIETLLETTIYGLAPR